MSAESPLVGGALAASLGSMLAASELQSLLVALFALAVREGIAWWERRRNRRPTVE